MGSVIWTVEMGGLVGGGPVPACQNALIWMFLFYCVFVCLCLHPLQCCLPGWILWCRYLCKYYLLVWHCMLHRHLRCFPVSPDPLVLTRGYTFSRGSRRQFMTRPAGQIMKEAVNHTASAGTERRLRSTRGQTKLSYYRCTDAYCSWKHGTLVFRGGREIEGTNFLIWIILSRPDL